IRPPPGAGLDHECGPVCRSAGGLQRRDPDRALRVLFQQLIRPAAERNREGRTIRRNPKLMSAALLAASAPTAFAETGHGANTEAIIMFLLFIAGTMGITWWAARRTQTTSDFYTAGGGISGFQNGLAIAGDYISAASFLGIAGMVYVS